MNQKESIAQLVGEVLDGTELKLKIDAYTLREDLESGIVEVRCDVHDERSGVREVISGKGVGIVDATFHGLVHLYSEKFPSLKTIRFADFAIKANVETGRVAARTDMAALVSLRVANSEGREFVFEHASPSITRSAIAVTLQGVEFFMNSERAFIAVFGALQHARTQNRSDSVTRYTSQLATLVEATSYTDTIANIRQSEQLK